MNFETEENNVDVISIESSQYFLEFIQLMLSENTENNGGIILSENSEELEFGKAASIIINPLNVELNERKMLSKLYKEMEDTVSENFYLEKAEAFSGIQILLEKAGSALDYPISYSEEFDLSKLLKVFDVKFLENHTNNVSERLIEYMKLAKELLHTKLFILVHFKDYFDEKQIKLFYETAADYKLQLLLIERYAYPAAAGERNYIIDKDQCLIYY
ncbi:MAG: type II-A CRISPR-associated protein Csn2 [Oscillospiraceae bacterium]|nr:type II-A CRISPR-associated protein Csn2 [Oscillospiraceae bacterium]